MFLGDVLRQRVIQLSNNQTNLVLQMTSVVRHELVLS